jgi:hypothetical protein
MSDQCRHFLKSRRGIRQFINVMPNAAAVVQYAEHAGRVALGFTEASPP